MNPFTLLRKALLWLRLALAVLLILFSVTGIGLIASSFWGPWGWVLGPLAVAAVIAAMCAFAVACYTFGDWWKRKEREYSAARREHTAAPRT